MSKSELVKKEAAGVAPDQGLSPLVQAVMNSDLDPDKLEKMLSIQKDYEANEAKKAFHKAVAEFKADAPKVIKDKVNSQYNSGYISKEGLVNAVNPYLSKHGLSAHWEIEQPDGNVKVTCVLTHELGHSERTSMSAPPDVSGKKNPIQQIKSTKTYLEIATYESITGIASSGSCNDDGNSVSVEILSEAQQEDILALITEVGANRSAFYKYFKITGLENVNAAAYPDMIRALEAKRK